MKKFAKVLVIVLAVLALAVGIVWYVYLRPVPPPISDADRARLEMMPLPANLKFTSGEFVIPRQWSVQYEAVRTSRLNDALDRFYAHDPENTNEFFDK